MPTVNAYALATVFFVASYFFNWHALLSTDWLVLDIPPFNRRMSYGLFQVCTNLLINECRPFPSTSYRDCEEKYFCEEWILSSSLMVAASAIGGLTLLYLMFVLIGGRYARETSWSLSQLATVFLISHLLYNSNKFYVGFKYGIGFSFAIVSASFNILIGFEKNRKHAENLIPTTHGEGDFFQDIFVLIDDINSV
ncbi:9884_t:CDS:2 [Entrophospora sp. SA101]|nr:9884_t:CDS:2 [Entrophospora sp. SA101]